MKESRTTNLYIWQHFCEFEEKNVFTVLTEEEHRIQLQGIPPNKVYCWHESLDGSKARLVKETQVRCE